MKSLEELKKLREEAIANVEIRIGEKDIKVVVGMGTCGIAAGARPVLTALVEEAAKEKLYNVQVVQTGCIGMCAYEPIVEVYETGKEKVTYVHVNPDKAKRIVAEHLANNNVVSEYTIGAEK